MTPRVHERHLIASLAPLGACVLLGGCLWNTDDAEREPDAFDEATARGAHVYGSRDRGIPVLATGGRMELLIEPALGEPYPSFLATTNGSFEATREGAKVTVRSPLPGDDVLIISDPETDRVYGRFELSAKQIADVRFLFAAAQQETAIFNLPPPRPLAVLAGGRPARFVIALAAADESRVLDHGLMVRAPDGVTVRREPDWDLLELQGVASTASPLSLEITAGGAPRTVELPVVTSLERIGAAPLTRPLVVGQTPVLCFEAIAQERAVQGVAWAFEAQNLTLSSSTTPGCTMVTSSQAGAASLTATANGLSHTISLTVAAQ